MNLTNLRIWRLWLLLAMVLCLGDFSFGQSWSGVLATSRATDWGEATTNGYGAGLPLTFPDGETTTQPWIPPTRTQCGSTLSPIGGGSDDTTNIMNALAACTAGHYVLLGSGTFTVSSSLRMSPGYNSGIKNVSIRGSGPMSTKIDIGASGYIYMGAYAGSNTCTVQSGSTFTQGSTSLVCSGSTPGMNTAAWITQCDTGKSGTNCGTGAEGDNGSVWVCADQTICSNQSASGSVYNNQAQYITITSASGSCSSSCTLTFYPGLYMPQWAYASSPVISFADTTYSEYGAGFENMTVDFSDGGTGANGGLDLDSCFYCWIVGVRFIGNNAGSCCGVYINQVGNSLFANNYLFMSNPITQAGEGLPTAWGNQSAVLMLNNIWQSGGGINDLEWHGPSSGDVLAYNYFRDNVTSQMYATDATHYGGIMMELKEGNQYGGSKDDNTWGTHDMISYFRNDFSCYDSPYSGLAAPLGIQINDFARFTNMVANVIGASGECTSYQTNNNTAVNYVFSFGSSDTLTSSTAMRWGNVSNITQSSDTPANSGIRCVSSEVPTSLASPNTAYENPLPSTPTPCGGSATIPASFFMDSVTAHPSGGTGLSWWKVCTLFSSFPSACSTTQTQPFPPIGPDVSGGSYLSGYAYDIPAAVAWKNLPVDTSYQNSYTITGSSYSSGTETLTVSSLPSGTNHIMGGFRLSGVNSACLPSSGVSYTGRSDGELLMTGSSSTTIKYAIASNPGVSCAGTMLFPDVRQFDEKVYESDSSATVAPTAPSPILMISKENHEESTAPYSLSSARF